jgi:predicted PurR-regulated permease PerM
VETGASSEDLMEINNPREPQFRSSKWGPTAKLVVGLSLTAILLVLVFYFRSIIGPLVLTFILAYLLHPIIEGISRFTGISWRFAVSITYIILLILLGVSFTLAGLAVAQQISNLYEVIERFVNQLPQLADEISQQIIIIGPFELEMSQLDLGPLAERILAILQPILGRFGGLLSTFAASAAAALGWGFFILIISYFLLAEAKKVPQEISGIEIPGYDEDFRRIGTELRRIWNAFLRGQFIIITLVFFSYTVVLTLLGVRFALALAILAALARFVPYLGPLTAWTVLGVVVFFQGANNFGLQSWQFMLFVLILVIILDQLFDNYISPRVFGPALEIHPAVVLIAAITAASFIGIIGLILAAPTVATLKLMGRYIIRKMSDQDPWPLVLQQERIHPTPVHIQTINRFREWVRTIKQEKIKRS